jgi:multidrug resistance efflux pump
VTLKAHVESFAPGDRARNSPCCRSSPGVGNFTKIVQRVPVKLRSTRASPTWRQAAAGSVGQGHRRPGRRTRGMSQRL